MLAPVGWLQYMHVGGGHILVDGVLAVLSLFYFSIFLFI